MILELSIITILSFLNGIFFVKYLSVHPLKMGLFLFLSCITAFISVSITIISINNTGFISVLCILIPFSIGYYLMAKIILSRSDMEYRPEIIKNRERNGGIAVIYFTHGEPELYDPIGWINQFKEFDEQKIKFVPFFARPFFLWNLRKHYLIVGKSHHRQEHKKMINSLEQLFNGKHNNENNENNEKNDNKIKFYLCFLDDHPRPDVTVIQALNDGASKIIVSEVFLTISNHTHEGESLIRKLDVEKYGVEIKYTEPLWNSATLVSMFTHRINMNRNGIDKSKIGVLLVGHGQPKEWDEGFKTETEQEILFREFIRNDLVKDGYNKENIIFAWMEFKEPKPKTAVEQLLKNDVEKIFFFSAAISADSIHSQYDVPKLINKADIPDNIEIKNLGAWNDDPIVIRAIKEKIDSII